MVYICSDYLQRKQAAEIAAYEVAGNYAGLVGEKREGMGFCK